MTKRNKPEDPRNQKGLAAEGVALEVIWKNIDTKFWEISTKNVTKSWKVCPMCQLKKRRFTNKSLDLG